MRLDRVALAMARAWLLRDGPATTLPLGLIAFVKSAPGLEAPDLEFMLGAPPFEASPGCRAGGRPTPTSWASGRCCCIRAATGRSRCAPPIRRRRCASPATSWRRPRISRRCAAASIWRASWRCEPALDRFRGEVAGARAGGADRCRDRRLDPRHRDHGQPPAGHLRDGQRAGRRAGPGLDGCVAWTDCAWSMHRRCPTCPRRISMRSS